MAKKEKKRRTNKGKIEKNEASSSLAKELEALKSENASLVCKYDSLARKYDKVIKSFACVTAVDLENERLEEKLGKLTGEHKALQANHKGLDCSYEKLVDSYATLEIAHEVVVSLVKFMQPLSHTCTCSQVQIDLPCINDCFSQASQYSIEYVIVESCSDLIAKENGELKQEVENLQRDLCVLKEKSKMQPSQDNHQDMVKNLEKGSIVASSTLQQHTNTHKNRIHEKSKVEHIKYQHRPTKHKAQESLSKKPRSSNKWRMCYKCKEKRHFADTCPNTTTSSGTDCERSDRMPPVRPVPARSATPRANKLKKTSSPRTRLRSKYGQEIARNDLTNKKKASFVMNADKTDTLAKIAQMVSFLKLTFSIMISVSLGTIRMKHVL
jgi:predicted nuclease with TOPRIM domain